MVNVQRLPGRPQAPHLLTFRSVGERFAEFRPGSGLVFKPVGAMPEIGKKDVANQRLARHRLSRDRDTPACSPAALAVPVPGEGNYWGAIVSLGGQVSGLGYCSRGADGVVSPRREELTGRPSSPGSGGEAGLMVS